MNKRILKKRVRNMLLAELAVRFATENEAITWLETPTDELEGRTPRRAIADGEIERVTLLLDQINSDAATS